MRHRGRKILAGLLACLLLQPAGGCSVPQPLRTTEQTRERDVERTAALPARYDYREAGRCPAPESQGSLGTCWAFATMMALESALMPEEQWNFSEDHISLRNSFGMDQDMGGDYTMSMAYLLAWQGPVTEEADPYGDGISPDGLEAVKHVQEIQMLAPKDYEAIKRAVYFRGGVQTSLYTAAGGGAIAAEYYNEETHSYCYRGSEGPNHDVVIVGWDDAYPRENFTEDPGMDGAFLCMNSWGEGFGENGLFYVSYGDTNLGNHSLVYTGIEEPDNFDRIYQSDLCGWLGQLGYGDEEAYFANVYEAEADGTLEAVGFYAVGEDTQYEVYIIEETADGEQLRLGRPAASGSFEHAGFYTVRLEEPVSVEAGTRFAAAVRVRTPGSVHPVAIEYAGSGGGLPGTVDLDDGEGYISADGRLWSRTEEQSGNVCLKVYGKDRGGS